MRNLSLIILVLLLLATFALIRPTFAYSRILQVDAFAPYLGLVNGDVQVQGDIFTGNNAVEYVHNVSATILLPESVRLVSGENPKYFGQVGPGPRIVHYNWTVEFEEPGEYLLVVNASCNDTQWVPQWMNASTSIRIYATPHVEFEDTPTTDVHVNDTVVFNATKSYAQGPNSQIATYAWDFADGTNATTFTPTIEHRFLKVGNYTVSLNVTDASPFQLSNTSSTQVTVTLLGDLNGDGQVNIIDITIIATAFNSEPRMPNWNPIADLNHDGTVNIIDLALVAIEYGNHD